jgi:cold shock protein
VAAGIMKRFYAEKGFGFTAQDGCGDVLVHFSAIQKQGYRTLEAGEHVQFHVKQSDKGLQAVVVRPAKAPRLAACAGSVTLTSSHGPSHSTRSRRARDP